MKKSYLLFQYLFENEDKVYIDVNDMTDSLQRKYRDYKSKKRNTFRTIRRAYDEITENLKNPSDSTLWQHDDDEVNLEVYF